MQNIGLYIGRFQPFHKGHKRIVDTMLGENEVCIVLIGLSTNESKNPYDFSTRLHFFTHTYSPSSHLHIYPLADEENDQDWIEHILGFLEIHEAKNITFYGGDLEHDSAIIVIREHISLFGERNISFREISRKDIPISGTGLRKNIQELGLESIEADIPNEVYQYLKEL